MITESYKSLRGPLLKVYIEAYMDLFLSSYIAVHSFMINDGEEFENYFQDFSNAFCSILAIFTFVIGVILPFYLRYVTNLNFDRLEDEKYQEKYGIFYEEYKLKTKSMAGYDILPFPDEAPPV